MTFRGVAKDESGLEMGPPVAYSGSPYISPSNLERLSHDKSRTRLTIQQQGPQPEAQRAVGRGDRLSRRQDIMLRKLEREQREHAARRAASHPPEVEALAPLGADLPLPAPAVDIPLSTEKSLS
jgi:hypothetical protein